MKIGTFATFMSPLATPKMIGDFGRRAEGAGLDSIWMGEHVALFDRNTYGYPGSKDGRIPVPDGGGMLDVTATFGFLAASTKTLRFGTGVEQSSVAACRVLQALGGELQPSRRFVALEEGHAPLYPELSPRVHTRREARFSLSRRNGHPKAAGRPKTESFSPGPEIAQCGRMHEARLGPVKVAALAFPVFFLGGLAFSLHGGPCTSECSTAMFWPTALGGPLAHGALTAALPRAASALASGSEASSATRRRWADLRRMASMRN